MNDDIREQLKDWTPQELKDLKLSENYMNYPEGSKEAPLTDPVMRCCGCQKLVVRAYLHEHGACACGSRRVQEVRHMRDNEITEMREKYPEFMKLFEEVSDEGATIG